MLHIQKNNERSFHWPLCGWIRALVAALEPPFPRFPCFVLSFVVMLNVSLLSISPPLSWVSPPLSLTLSLFAFLTISECSFHSLSTNDLTDRESSLPGGLCGPCNTHTHTTQAEGQWDDIILSHTDTDISPTPLLSIREHVGNVLY